MKAKTSLKYYYISAVFIAAVAVTGLWYTKYWQPKLTALWNSDISRTNTLARSPAQFTESDLPLIEDYFNYNSFHQFISYRLNLAFMTDANSKNKRRAKEALDKTTHSLFKKDDKIETLKSFASPNLVSNFISAYLEQLDLAGVSKGNFQVDLEFTPRNHPSVLYDREARSVNLWDLNQSKSLKAAIGEKNPPSSIPDNEEFRLIRKIATTDYPSEGQYYQYQGGVISLQLELDKLDWSAEDQRSDKAKELDGDLVYRRYFKIVHEDEFSFFLDHPDMALNNSAMVKTYDDVPVFMTVDISREFNGHTLLAPKEQLSIHIGDMLPTQKRKRGFLQRIFGSDDKSVFKTGELRLYGRLGKGEGGIEFEAVVHTLVYNLGSSTFNAQDSNISITLKKENLNGYSKASATNDIKRILLGPMSGGLAKSLSLGRFHPLLKQTAGGR